MTQGSNFNRSKKILLFGGAGYVGLVLALQLIKRGFQVAILDNFLYGQKKLCEPLTSLPGFTLIEGDIRDIALVNRACQGCFAAVLLAALVGEKACDRDRVETFEVNYLAPLNVLESSKLNQLERLIFISTDSCYGARENEPLDEFSNLAPLSLYSELKAKIETEFLKRTQGTSLSLTVLRLATVYGLAPRTRFDLAVNLLTREAVLKGRAKIFSGEQWRPLVHVRDVAKAAELTLTTDADKVMGQIFNVGANEQNVQFKDFVGLLKILNPAAEIQLIPEAPDLRDYYVKFDKISKVLGFKAEVSLLEGMEELKMALLNGQIPDPYQNLWLNA
jgi:nucleoside-diphosphate-sugar epimerase